MHVAIIGCGQLARLLAQAGKDLGITTSFIALENESIQCVKGLGRVVHWHRPMSIQGLLDALDNPDVITVERENVDVRLMLELSMHVKVYPSPECVATCKNRLKEKLALSKLNIAATPWLLVDSAESVKNAVHTFGLPVVIKALEDGYDGKNQWHIKTRAQLHRLLKESSKINWIVEPKIDFIKEVSLIGVRSNTGECKFYPLTENRHQKGILRSSIAPDNSIDANLLKLIEDDLQKLFNHWQYVGVMAMELFIVQDGFYVNELAPRVHNSGHWTVNRQGATKQTVTSQFENHLRAILGMPLGLTDISGFAGMVNILGSKEIHQSNLYNDDLIIDQSEHTQSKESRKISIGEVFMYNKTPKPNRKLGHVNLLDDDRQRLVRKIEQMEVDIYGPSITEGRLKPSLDLRT